MSLLVAVVLLMWTDGKYMQNSLLLSSSHLSVYTLPSLPLYLQNLEKYFNEVLN